MPKTKSTNTTMSKYTTKSHMDRAPRKGEVRFYTVYFLRPNGQIVNYKDSEQKAAMREAIKAVGANTRTLLTNKDANEKIAQFLADRGYAVRLDDTIGFYA